MSGHTKGPWKIDFGHPRGNPCGISAKNDGRLVTRFGVFARPSTPEALANARLIAAAPDLLEAAMSGVECVMAGMGINALANDDERNEVVQEIIRRLGVINAAISRATGDRPEKGGA